VGPYQLSERVGAGGMGEVWVAEDTKLRRRVALKRVLSELAHSPQAIARFEREARAQAALSSPHIAALHGIERLSHRGAPDEVYLVMEYVEGQSLRSVLKAGALPIDDAIGLFAQLAMALSTAHRAGVVHRDLKPSNLLLRTDGSLVVVDFGVALQPEQLGDRDEDITGTGTIVGSAAYMSPQQAAGERVGPDADVWSAGVTLYVMLTGRQPFEGDSPAEQLAAVLRDEPTPVRELRPDAPKALSNLVDRCLKKDPADRPRDGDAMLELLPSIPIPITGRSGGLFAPEIIVRGTAHPPLGRGARLAAVVAALLALGLALWSVREGRGETTRWLPPAEGERLAGQLLDRMGLGKRLPHRISGYLSEDLQSPSGESSTVLWVRAAPAPHYVAKWLASPRHPPSAEGEVTVMFTPDGTLRLFDRVLDASAAGNGQLPVLLEAAGLHGPLRFEEPVANRLRGVDLRRARAPDGSAVDLAMSGQDVVRFERADLPPPPLAFHVPNPGRGGLILLALFGLAGWLAIGHARQRRGDTRGAVICGLIVVGINLARLAAAPQALWLAQWGPYVHQALTGGTATALAYFAAEPLVRRYWPGTLVGWERLIRWRSRDHALGRELLLGCAATLPVQLALAVQTTLGISEIPGLRIVALGVGHPSSYVLLVLFAAGVAIGLAITLLFVSAIAVRLLRLHWVAAVSGTVIPFLVFKALLGPHWPAAIAGALCLVALIYRGGLMALGSFFLFCMLPWMTLSPEVARWSLPYSATSVGLAFALLGWGIVMARRLPRVATQSRVSSRSPAEVAATSSTRKVAGDEAPEGTVASDGDDAPTKPVGPSPARYRAPVSVPTESVEHDAMPTTVRARGAAPAGEPAAGQGDTAKLDAMPSTVRAARGAAPERDEDAG